MTSVPLPQPSMYADWKQFANALISALSDDTSGGTSMGDIQYVVANTPVAPENLPQLPAGYAPVWLNSVGAQMYLGNPAFDPPSAPNLFMIDTGNIADAAIETAQLGDRMISTAKIAQAAVSAYEIAINSIDSDRLQNQAVTTGKIVNLAVGSAQIANLAVGSGQMGDLSVVSAKVGNAAIGTAKIADAAIVSALIGDLQVIQAKINDLAVNSAKIGNLAVSSGKIANLAVGAAQIQLLAVGSAQIANLGVDSAQINNLAVASGKIADAAILTAKIADAQILLAKIADAQISSAKIQDLAVGSAKIADAAIGTAKIADASITNAKVVSLVVNKILSGQLNAVIDVAAGRFVFTVGATTLYIGNGFGSSNQFFLWFGLTPGSGITGATEGNAIVYLKTNGTAYFGGTLAAGVIRNAAQSTSVALDAMTIIGPFTSNGGTISVVSSYSWQDTYQCNAGTGSISGSGSASLITEVSTNGGGSWATLNSWSAGESARQVVVDGDPGIRDRVTWGLGGSSTMTWNPGAGSNFMIRTRVTGRTSATLGGTSIINRVQQQNLTIAGTE